MIAGLDNFVFPSYSFLVSNRQQDRHVLFDLGMRKDWEASLPPGVMGFVKKHMPFNVERNMDEILDQDPGKLGITARSISSVLWSHHHFDHRGDVSAFTSNTEVVVGPGFSKAYLPGYPANEKSSVLESEVQGRPLRELGHTQGYISALARVATDPNPSFIFMGGDCIHYAGILRPNTYLPLPQAIPAVPGSRFGVAPCPGVWMQSYVHPTHSATEPFLHARPGVNENQDQAEHTLASVQEFDARDEVLDCTAHDISLLGNLPFYPDTLNYWRASGRKEAIWWSFCGDFNVKAAKHAMEGH